jgi:hypothetical protein
MPPPLDFDAVSLVCPLVATFRLVFALTNSVLACQRYAAVEDVQQR